MNRKLIVTRTMVYACANQLIELFHSVLWIYHKYHVTVKFHYAKLIHVCNHAMPQVILFKLLAYWFHGPFNSVESTR